MGFRLVPKLVTSNNLERCNNRRRAISAVAELLVLIAIRGGAGNLWLGGPRLGGLGKSPSGVQGRSPGRGSGGRSPPEAEALSEKNTY